MVESRVIVLGCGVSGLTCGVRLLEAGYSVRVWARDLPPHTTSNVAAAIWEPYKAYPVDKVTEWGQRSFEVFCDMAGSPGTGVAMTEVVEVWRERTPDPAWSGTVRRFRRLSLEDLPAGFVDGYMFETPVIEMDIYLGYLIGRFESLGGEIVERAVSSLAEALAEAPVVVNCTGLGARALVGDQSLFPIKGQVVRVAKPEGLTRTYLDDDERLGLTYIVPRSADCILGGTAQVGNWSLEPDPQTAAGIIERCSGLVPELASAQVLEHRVGLRPGRPSVRLEAERLPSGGLVVHDYGHGGAGVTLSWGCAEEVVRIISIQA